jgi:MFS family permease
VQTSSVVLATSIVARLPQGMAPLGVVLLVQERTGSIATAGLAAGAWALAAALGQPLWAGPASRGRAERVIAGTSVGQALVVLFLAVTSIDTSGLLILLAGLGGVLAAPTSPVARTLWPELAADQRQLDALFTLDATTQELIFIAGPAVVAVLVSVGGPAAALSAAAGAGAAGGLLFAYTIRKLWTPSPREAGDRLPRRLVIPFVVLFLAALGIGFVEVGVPAAAILDGNRNASGWLLALWSLGSLVGGVVASRITWRGRPADRVAGLLLGLTVGTGVVILTWHFGLGWLGLGLFVAGLTLAPTLAACYGVIGDVTTRQQRTNAFAWAVTFILFGIGVGAAVGGVLSDISPTWAFTAGTVGTLLALTVWTSRSHAQPTTVT